MLNSSPRVYNRVSARQYDALTEIVIHVNMLKEGWDVTNPYTIVLLRATACRNLKLPSFSARSLRRMFIIDALKKGIAVKRISRWQGHKDGGVLILKTYSEVIEQEDDREAANLLA